MTNQNTPSTVRQLASDNAGAWTAERISALGATTDIPTLAEIFDCSQWKAYEMARTGKWQESGIRIIRIGACYKVSVASVLATLGHVSPPSSPRT